MAIRFLHRMFTFSLCLVMLLSLLPVYTSLAISHDIVISQVYGGGGNLNAPYQNDFVELFNRGNEPVSISGWSVQYASATGTGNFSYNPITVLSGTIQPGQYYLVKLYAGNSCSSAPCGSPIPSPDAIGTVNMGNSGGKVALVTSTSGLTCNGSATPCSPDQLALIEDLIGWGGANFYETAAAPATSNTTADLRANNGCSDTDNNSADFAAAAPNPRNSSSTKHYCTPPSTKIYLPIVIS